MSEYVARDETRAYQAQRLSELADMAKWECNRGRAHSPTPMKTLPTLKPITEPVATLGEDTRRLIELTNKNRRTGFLTEAEAAEADQIVKRHEARRRAADLAHDQATEAHAFERHISHHDD